MLSEAEASARILASVAPGASHAVPLEEALGRFSAHPVHATVPLPGFDNSAMDGYAVKAADTQRKAPLHVIGTQPAGRDLHLTLQPGAAIRIFTGAPMPQGADAVIMQEDVEPQEEGRQIDCLEPAAPGEYIRLTGCDLCVGQRVLDAGDRLTPARLSVLASQGLSQVDVIAPPRIAIITTGDELVDAGQPLQSGQLYNSNATLLAALVGELGITQITRRHLRDDLQETIETLRETIASHDLILLSGGVSVGDRDFIKPALQALGITTEFWRVKIQPGKPLLFVSAPAANHTCHLFGLPGNPVSSFVTFQLFVRPALRKMMGATDSDLRLPQVRATLAQPLVNKGDRPHYLRGQFTDGKFITQGLQQSHALFGLSQANALLRMEPTSALEAGTDVLVLLL